VLVVADGGIKVEGPPSKLLEQVGVQSKPRAKPVPEPAADASGDAPAAQEIRA
jgi:hypothetical protein